MFDFENKPVKDWTLAEAKEYCEKHYCGNYFCTGKNCVLNDSDNCIGHFKDLNLNNILKFTPDEIAFCRLIKKTIPWTKYIARSSVSLAYLELQPVFTDKGYFETGRTGMYTILDNNLFPQIKPLTCYAIDDIIEQGEKNID